MANDELGESRFRESRAGAAGSRREEEREGLVAANRFGILLCTFVLVGGVIPIVEELRGADPIFAKGVFFLALAAAGFVARRKALRFAVMTAVGAAGMALLWWASAHGSRGFVTAGTVLLLLFLVSLATSILRFVLGAKRVTTETIAASLCVYVVVGLAWAFAFSLAYTLRPSSFRISDATFWEFVYYSFATLTTLGYDGIVASSRVSKSLAVVEAIVGQFYVAVLVSRLVGLYIVEVTSERQGLGGESPTRRDP